MFQLFITLKYSKTRRFINDALIPSYNNRTWGEYKMKKQSTLYLIRHLAAREDLLVGDLVEVIGASKGTTAIVGNGVHPDDEAHLQASEYAKAEEIGEKNLIVPEGIESVLILPSPKARAVETARHLFIGMCRQYAKNHLGITDFSTADAKKRLSKSGLHKITFHASCNGLNETSYKNSKGYSDGGNELVAQAYCKEVNPDFPGYRYMVQKGFENDQRSEHPGELADRALIALIPNTCRYDLILATTHQPNLEIITSALTGNYGKDANELWQIAGGGYALGGGFKLTVEYDFDEVHHPSTNPFTSATLIRTPADKGTLFETQMPVDLSLLDSYRQD